MVELESQYMSKLANMAEEFFSMPMGKRKDATSEILTSATQDQEFYRHLKCELDAQLSEVLVKLDQMSQQVKANIRSEQNPHGLLFQKEAQYLACLQINHREFERLLNRDEATIAENYEMARHDPEKRQNEIQALLNESQKHPEQLLMRQKASSLINKNELAEIQEKVTYELKKLPVWGIENLSFINFEWPTQEQFAKMTHDTKIKSIQFKMED